MDFTEDSDEEYTGYIQIKTRGSRIDRGQWFTEKKFLNENLREYLLKEPSASTSKATTTNSKRATKNIRLKNIKIANQNVDEIVELREKKFWCSRFTPNSFLVSLTYKEESRLQKLADLGYYQADRCRGLTFDEAKLALSKLAEVHADYLIHRNRPNDIVQCQREANRIYRVPHASKEIAHAAIIAINTYLSYPEKTVNKIKDNVHKLDTKMQNILQGFTGNKIRVLNHGDAWINNFIFKQENSVLKDVMLLPSQLPHYGSLGLDLNFFLHTSLQVEVLKGQREELLRSYHESLYQIMLTKRRCVVPSIDTILKEVRACEFYSFYVVMCELPLVCLERKQCGNLLCNSLSDKEFANKMSCNFFKSARVLNTLQYTLERLDELGVLDKKNQQQQHQ